MAKSMKMGLSAILLLVIGILMIMMGIKGIIDYNSAPNELKRAIASLLGGGKKDVIVLIIAILDIIAGVILVLSVFLTQQIPLLSTATLVVIIYWGVRTVYNLFVNGISYDKQIQFQPDFISWIIMLGINATIILALLAATKD